MTEHLNEYTFKKDVKKSKKAKALYNYAMFQSFMSSHFKLEHFTFLFIL